MATGIAPGDLPKMVDNRSRRWAAVCGFYAAALSAESILFGCFSLSSAPGRPDDRQNTPAFWRPRGTAPFPTCPPGPSNVALGSAHFRSTGAQAQSGSGGRHFVTGRPEAEGAAGPRFRVRRAEAAGGGEERGRGCGDWGGCAGRLRCRALLGKERRVGELPRRLVGAVRGAAYAEAVPSSQRPVAGPPCAPGCRPGAELSCAAGGGGRSRPANVLPVPLLSRRPPDGRADRQTDRARRCPGLTPWADGRHRAAHRRALLGAGKAAVRGAPLLPGASLRSPSRISRRR